MSYDVHMTTTQTLNLTLTPDERDTIGRALAMYGRNLEAILDVPEIRAHSKSVCAEQTAVSVLRMRLEV